MFTAEHLLINIRELRPSKPNIFTLIRVLCYIINHFSHNYLQRLSVSLCKCLEDKVVRGGRQGTVAPPATKRPPQSPSSNFTPSGLRIRLKASLENNIIDSWRAPSESRTCRGKSTVAPSSTIQAGVPAEQPRVNLPYIMVTFCTSQPSSMSAGSHGRPSPSSRVSRFPKPSFSLVQPLTPFRHGESPSWVTGARPPNDLLRADVNQTEKRNGSVPGCFTGHQDFSGRKIVSN